MGLLLLLVHCLCGVDPEGWSSGRSDRCHWGDLGENYKKNGGCLMLHVYMGIWKGFIEKTLQIS